MFVLVAFIALLLVAFVVVEFVAIIASEEVVFDIVELAVGVVSTTGNGFAHARSMIIGPKLLIL